MTNSQLIEHLRQYVGQRVRIQSNMIHSPHFRKLTDVTEAGGMVWVHAEEGESWVVSADGLTVEAEPVTGTFDGVEAVEQMRQIGAARRAYDESAEVGQALDPHGVPKEVEERNKADGGDAGGSTEVHPTDPTNGPPRLDRPKQPPPPDNPFGEDF